MKRVINAVIRIEYETDDNSYWSDMPDEDKENTAVGLAVQPNFSTRLCGITLDCVQLDVVNTDDIVDWSKLKHNPDRVFVKP